MNEQHLDETSSSALTLNPYESAKLIALRQSRGSDMQSLLVPPPISDAPLPLIAKPKEKVPKKNFQKQYRSALREMQNKNKEKVIEDSKNGNRRLRKLSAFKNVSSRVFGSCSTACGSTVSSSRVNIGIENEDDGVSCLTSSIASEGTRQTTKNYLLLNKLDAMKIRPRPETPEEKVRLHESYGKVPEYVLKRKEELAQLRQIKEDEENPIDIIPEGKKNIQCLNHPHVKRNLLYKCLCLGMMLLPEQERRETLSLLYQKQDDAKKQLQSLPFTGDSLKLKKRRKNLEDSLLDIDNAIRLFQKDKVYIQSK